MIVSNVETIVAFDSGFERVNLHRPTTAAHASQHFLAPPTFSTWARGLPFLYSFPRLTVVTDLGAGTKRLKLSRNDHY